VNIFDAEQFHEGFVAIWSAATIRRFWILT
jgi:hypothetical protein